MSMSDGAGDVEMRDGNENEEHTEEQKPKKVYIPGVSRPLKDNEELEYDPEAYRLFHTFETELPCLSFDVIKDELGENRENYPATCYLVGGTQAEKRKDNQLVIMRLSNMNPIEKEKEDEDSEEGQSSDEEEAEEEREKAKLPVMQAAIIPHYGDVNRVKCQNIGPTPVCAVWNEQGKVQIWNLSNSLAKINASEERNMFSTKMTDEKALYSFNGHSTSGYALGWSPLKEGALASGDSYKNIFLWQMGEGGTWVVDQRALKGHESSVEDLQWSVTEEPLLASCSTDRSIRLWDIRLPPQQACVHTLKDAHESDVNVISWNRHEPLIVSGSDDTVLKIWSLKTIQYNQPVAMFKHHKKPITSVEWSWHESTTLMAAGEDDQTTIWDLAVESDSFGGATESDKGEQVESKVPPQLLFVHMGQKEIKEVHWHPQVTGLATTTALDGFHVFRTINV